MKKLKKFIALFTAALFCILPLLSQPLTAQASTPTTYYLKYIGSEWRFIPNVTSWDDTVANRELYYMQIAIEDGDIIIVDGAAPLELNLDVTLGNLTILYCDLAVVHAKGYNDLYVSNTSVAAINGNVKNATVLTGATANFNNNVENLRVEGNATVTVLGNTNNLYVYDPSYPSAYVSAHGTVAHLNTFSDYQVYNDFYNFKAGTLLIENGYLRTVEENFSKTPVASTTTPTTKPSAGELDDVPKTGDFSVSPVWFLGLAVVCMLGYRKLERR